MDTDPRTASLALFDAADVVVTLLGDPALGTAWDSASALAEFSVSGLAGHLGGQILTVRSLLELPTPAESPTYPVVEHYRRAAWIDAPLDAPANVDVRERGEQASAGGRAVLLTEVVDALGQVRDSLPGQPDDRRVHIPWAGWSLSLADFLITRTLEMAVHTDDLAVSIGVETPAMSEHVQDVVLPLLVRLAARRHGTVPVLRALSRAERAPDSIAAI